MPNQSSTNHYGLSSPDFMKNPESVYVQLREHDPIYWLEPFQGWAISRHEDCSYMIRNQALFTTEKNLIDPVASNAKDTLNIQERLYQSAIFFQDSARHTELRRFILSTILSSKYYPLYTHIAGSLALQTLRTASEQDSFDLVSQYSTILPTAIIGGILQIPAEEISKIRNYCEKTAIFFSGMGMDDPDVKNAMEKLYHYLRRLLYKNNRSSVVQVLLHEASNYFISLEDIIYIVIQIFGASYLTLLDTISISMLTLIQNKKANIFTMYSDKDLELMIDESLRFYSPVQIVTRFVVEDTVYKGYHLKRGQTLYLILASANRDRLVFHQPDQMDPHRANLGKAISFGAGPHYCIGAKITKALMLVLLKTYLASGHRFELKEDVTWRQNSLFFRGPDRIQLSGQENKPRSIR